MIDPGPYLIELQTFGFSECDHSGRSFREHLVGVFQILSEWGNDDDLCLAGLFHSVYGTEYFDPHSQRRVTRKQLVELIGESAEELVYLFCVCERDSLLRTASEMSANLAIWNRSESRAEPITESIFSALAELTYANLLEQLPHLEDHLENDQRAKLFEKWAPLSRYVSVGAKQQFRSYSLGEYLGKR